MAINLLTSDERFQLPLVLNRRTKFKQLVKASVTNYNNIFSNCMLLQGKPGTGKTTIISEYLDQLTEAGIISGYRRASGHITPRSLYGLLDATKKPSKKGKPMVLVLDDVDCLSDQGCLELMKAAFDTKSLAKTNRHVYYMTESGSGFKYDGFGIIITNREFNPDKITVHQQALLDRVQMVTVDLKKDDAVIYNSYLIEQYINDNPDNLSDKEISNIVTMFNNEIRKWLSKDAFRKSGVNFSIRLIKKFIDAQRIFGDDWREFNIIYQKLEAASEMADLVDTPVSDVTITKDPTMPPMVDGKFINPRTGKPYSDTYQSDLRKKYGLGRKVA